MSLPQPAKLVILSVTSYILNPFNGRFVDADVGIPHVVPLETLRSNKQLNILLDLVYANQEGPINTLFDGWTVLADLRPESSYTNPITDTIDQAVDRKKVSEGPTKFKKRLGDFIYTIYTGFPEDGDFDDDGILKLDETILSGRIVGRVVIKR